MNDLKGAFLNAKSPERDFDLGDGLVITIRELTRGQLKSLAAKYPEAVNADGTAGPHMEEFTYQLTAASLVNPALTPGEAKEFFDNVAPSLVNKVMNAINEMNHFDEAGAHREAVRTFPEDSEQ